MTTRTAYDPAARGHHAMYRQHEVNHCPGCGRTHWLIGRLLAECGFCATALPLQASLTQGVPTMPRPQLVRRPAMAWAA